VDSKTVLDSALRAASFQFFTKVAGA